MPTWATVAIVLLVMGMAAWPIMQLIPKPGQKRIIEIRQRANRLGLKVDIILPELPEALLESHQLSANVLYRKPQPLKCKKTITILKSSVDDSWFYPGHQASHELNIKLQPLLKSLPTFINAIEISHQGTAAFIRETKSALNEPTILEELAITLNQANKLFV